MLENSHSQNTLTLQQIRRLTMLETKIRAHYAQHLHPVLAGRLSLAYHPGCDAHSEHIVLRMGHNSTQQLKDIVDNDATDALPVKVFAEMEAALANNFRTGNKKNFIAVDGRFEDALAIIEGAVEEIKTFYSAQRLATASRRGGGSNLPKNGGGRGGF